MSIEINNESGVVVDEARILGLATFALDFMNIHPDAELSIVCADEKTMEKLHIDFMDEPGPTDVLSFPMDELRPGTAASPTPPGLLGDIVLCPTVAATQADQAGHSAIHEMLWLTAHGVLHLLGYDHAEPEEEREMFGLQRQILDGFFEIEKA
jgi:probable rRNA maturation factor